MTAGSHRRGSTTAQTNQHTRAAELNEQRARFEGFLLEGLSGLDRTHTTGNHDRLVVPVDGIAHNLLIGTEIASQIWPAEFVVEGSRTNRTFDHDVQRAGDAIRLTGRTLPRLLGIRQIQIRHGKAAETCLGLGTTSGRTFITDLTTGTGSRTRERRNRCRVIMRFYLGQVVRQFIAEGIGAVSGWIETLDFGPFHDGGIIRVGHHSALRRPAVRIANHAEQRLGFSHAVDDPVGVENLVAAMFGVRLREHHQLHVGRITPGFGEDRPSGIRLHRRRVPDPCHG